MSNLSKDDILAALPKLTRDNLEEVHALSGHLLATGRIANVPTPPVAEQIFNALVAPLGLSMRYETYSPMAKRQFDSKVPEFVKFLDDFWPEWNRNKISATAFLSMLFNLLCNELRAQGIKPSLGILVINMPRIPQVLDNEFPGYRKSGMGYLIIKPFVK